MESPPIAPVDLDAIAAADEIADQSEAADAETVQDIDDVEHVEGVAAWRFARPVRRKRLDWPLSHLQSAILTLIIVDAIIVGWRSDFVRAMPQTASFYACDRHAGEFARARFRRPRYRHRAA